MEETKNKVRPVYRGGKKKTNIFWVEYRIKYPNGLISVCSYTEEAARRVVEPDEEVIRVKVTPYRYRGARR